MGSFIGYRNLDSMFGSSVKPSTAQRVAAYWTKGDPLGADVRTVAAELLREDRQRRQMEKFILGRVWPKYDAEALKLARRLKEKSHD